VTSEEFRQLMAEAADDLALALVKLWVALDEGHLFLQEAVERREADPKQYDGLRAALEDALKRETTLPGALESQDALAALTAMDAVLAYRTQGMAPANGTYRIKDKTYWLLGRSYPIKPSFSKQPAQFQFWVKHHWVCPQDVHGIKTSFRHMEQHVSEAIKGFARRGIIKLYVASFEDDVEPAWKEPKPRYRAEVLQNPDKRWQSVEQVLQDAQAHEADIIVLPELTLCPELRRRVADLLRRRQLRAALVVPGSFHVSHGDKVRGEAVLMDATGELLHTHHKLAPMRVEHGSDQDTIRENIHAADMLQLLLSPVGPVAVAICLDYCEANDKFSVLWDAVAPGLVLVPSMGPPTTASAHEKRAHALHTKHSTITAVATQPERPEPEGGASRGLVVGTDVAGTKRMSENLKPEKAEVRSFTGKCYQVRAPMLDDQPTQKGTGQA
jgi:hypothetical protein